MINKLAAGIVRVRWAIIVLFVLLVGGLAAGIGQFKIDASADTLLVKNNKLYIESQLAAQVFSPDEFILLAYQPESHPLYSRQTFDDIAQMSEQIQKMERVEAVTSILTVPLIQNKSSLTGDTDVSQLSWQTQKYSPQQMQQLISGHPIFTDLLVNREDTATAIQVVFRQNPELQNLEQQMTEIEANLLTRDLTEEEQTRLAGLKAQADPIKQALTRQRQQEIDQLNQIASQVNGRASTYLGGSYVVGQHLVDIIRSDLTLFGSAIAAVIALLLLILYRSVRWVIFPLGACAVSVSMTMGLFGWLDMRTTVISANFIALQLILTLAVMIHLIGAYRDISHQQPDLNQYERVTAMLEQKLSPCFYATLTTSVGFASLIFSGLQPVVDFGYMMLSAMIITMLVGLLLFPALLALLSAKHESHDFNWITGLLNKLKILSLRAPGTITVLILLIFGGTAFGISRLNVENSFIDYFAKDTQVYQELAFIDKQFGGSTPLDIILDIGEVDDKQQLILTADTVNQLQLVQAAVKAFEATGSVTSIANFTELAKQLNDNKPLTEYELTAIYRLLDEKVVDQLVGAYFSPQTGQLRVSVRVQDTTDNLNRATFLQSLKQDLSTVGVATDDVQLTSLFVLYQDILSRLFDSQVTTLGIVYLVLAVVLLVIFRSIKVALIALIPNVLTTLGILGVIGWLGIPLDIMTITIAAIAMGIAVDDTIHFVHAWLSGHRQGDAGQACNEAFGHTGMAILFTTTIIATGFSLFGLSDFIPSVNFGLLTASAMIMALVTDLTLLPALLNKFVGRTQTQSAN